MVSKLEKLREMLHHAIENGNTEEILMLSRRLDKAILVHTRKQLKQYRLKKNQDLRQGAG